MASITQTIPNYTSGISEQPDQLKNPGQVKEALNVIPEVQTGLVKRPGSRFIKNLQESIEDATYFHYYRDQDEQYIGQVTRNTDNPAVTLWPLRGDNAGEAIGASFDSTNITAIKQYLKHTDKNDLQFLTINDYTYILNRNAKKADGTDNPCNMTNDVTPGWGNADTNGDVIGHANFAYIELKKTANARQYSLNLNKTSNTGDNAETYSLTSATKLIHKKDYPDHTVIDTDGTSAWDPGNHASRPITATNGVVTNATGKPFHSRQIQDGGKFNGRTEGSCVDIGTDVFSSEDAVCTIYDVAHNELNATSVVTLNRELPKNLIFRFTVKGRSSTWHDADNNDINGEDYVCTYDYDVELLHGGEGWQKGDYIKFVMVQTTGPDASTDGNATNNINYISPTYYVKVKEIEKSDILAKIGSVNGDGAIRPAPTAFDADMAVSATTILGGLQQAILNPDDNDATTDPLLSGAEIIGNGLYIYNTDSFNVSTAESDLMNIVTDEVNDVTKLPSQCKHGMVVKVANSDANEDDYFMRFYGNDNQDGPGGWRECVMPGIRYKIDPATMPVQLIREATGGFKLQLGNYIERQVGNNVTNPKPSFLSRGVSLDGVGDLSSRYLTNMLFWRNRIVFLSSTNVICSQPGGTNLVEPNFWAETALTVSPTDAIDLSTSSTSPAKLFEGIEIGQGLLLSSENAQFLLSAEAEVLTPETAKLTPQATYNYNTQLPFVSLGTTIGFLDNAGKNSKFFEATNIQRGYEPEILNQSIAVPDLMPKLIDLVTNSRENTYILFAIQGTNTIYGYRYFNSGEKRIQSAWFKWELDKPIRYMAILDDLFYVIHTNGNLVKFPLVDKWANWIEGFPIHLDNWTRFPVKKKNTDTDTFTYNADDNKTTFDLDTFGFDDNRTVYVLDATPGSDLGRYGVATVNGQTATLIGDWASARHELYVGYNFSMKIQLPTIYPRSRGEVSAADITSSLVVHRLKFSLGAAGVYETTLERTGKLDYTELVESSLQDAYIANSSPWVEQKIHTLPVYERNKNLNIYLKSTHPSPTTLYSMSWEGDYSNKFYQRA